MVTLPDNVYKEENEQYCLDCREAVWSEGDLHGYYSCIGNLLTDVDFIFEDDKYIYLMEYKNASISGAANPSAFNPVGGNKIENVSKKFYDSLHYLNAQDKCKPRKYIYVVQYPNGDTTSRRVIRNKLRERLPFRFQRQGNRLIESVEVLSIEEWNQHEIYKNYPLVKIEDFQNSDS